MKEKRKVLFFINDLWSLIVVWNMEGNVWQWQTISILLMHIMKKNLMDKSYEEHENGICVEFLNSYFE